MPTSCPTATAPTGLAAGQAQQVVTDIQCNARIPAVLNAASVRIPNRPKHPELVILALRGARNGGAVKPPCRQDDRVLPQRMPVIDHAPVMLREFRDSDIAAVLSAGADPLIPLITTVPAGGTPRRALAYIQRQRQRLPSGAGNSFAIASALTGEAVGQNPAHALPVPGFASAQNWLIGFAAPAHLGLCKRRYG